eukprot:4513649-Pyramimonas_sp.AAC.1
MVANRHSVFPFISVAQVKSDEDEDDGLPERPLHLRGIRGSDGEDSSDSESDADDEDVDEEELMRASGGYDLWCEDEEEQLEDIGKP